MKNRKREEIINTLKNVSIFKQFAQKTEELEKLANIMNIVYAKKGETIIKEGEEGDVLYIIKKGCVNILKRTLENEQYVVVKLESKEGSVVFFGELALLDNDTRSATVTADSDCEFLVVKRDDFIKLGDEHPNLGLQITREISKILAGRLRRANKDIITLFEALVEEIGSVQSK